MATTVNRLMQGVHKDGICGSNTTGFAAIESLSDNTDFHILNNIGLGRAPVTTISHNKVNMLSSDAFAYIVAKFLSDKDHYSNYTLLLRENMHIPSCIRSMILSLPSIHIFTVVPNKGGYTVTSYFNKTHSVVRCESLQNLSKLVNSMNLGRSSMYIAYPELTDDYISVLNSLKLCNWCVPSVKNRVYVSSLGKDHYVHRAYPWSGQSQCKGYTVGSGAIVLGSPVQQSSYIGSFGFYESFISCIPYRGRCPDCHELYRVAKYISGAIDSGKTGPRGHVMKRASITVLEDMKRILNKTLEGHS